MISVLAMTTAPASAETRAEAGLAWMLETCAAFLETGKRAVLGDIVAAAKDGTPCEGDEACAGPEMTFFGDGPAGEGAVRLQIPGGVRDMPPAGLCEPAPGTGMLTANQPRVLAWADKAVASGRLAAHDGVYAGCAWNDRLFHFLPQGGPMAAFRFHLDADAPSCAALAS